MTSRIPVRGADELPRHFYPVHGSIREILDSQETLTGLFASVRRDLADDLGRYDIQDRPTLRDYEGLAAVLAIFDGDLDDAEQHVDALRQLQDKPASRAVAGHLHRAVIAAMREAGGAAGAHAALRRHFEREVAALPWDLAQERVIATKGSLETKTEAFLVGWLKGELEPVIERTGGLGFDQALNLARAVYELRWLVPHREALIEIYGRAIEAHRQERTDIWPARAAALPPDRALTPVVVAVWDSGIDMTLFPGQTLPPGPDGEPHMAFDLDYDPAAELLMPIEATGARIGELLDQTKGMMDLRASKESAEAAVVKAHVARLDPDAVVPFMEELGLIGGYMHGTHVAGIAVAGNPWARLLCIRVTFDHRTVPSCPTKEWAQRFEQAIRAIAGRCRSAGARVVNMSWVIFQQGLRESLEKNGVGSSAEEREQLARELFRGIRDALEQAMAQASGILFVGGAGNFDDDAGFMQSVPPSLDLPNLVIVGAVDASGEPTSFTTTGKAVDVYASGDEVDSFVPGGRRMKLSGSSMAAPQVANLAAKLLAVDPALSPEQLIALILEGAERNRAGYPIIHPRRTLEMLLGRVG